MSDDGVCSSTDGSSSQSSSENSSSSSQSSTENSSSQPQSSSAGGTSSPSSTDGSSSNSSSQSSTDGSGDPVCSARGSGSGSGSGTNAVADGTTPGTSAITLTVQCAHTSPQTRKVVANNQMTADKLQIVPTNNSTTLQTGVKLLQIIQLSVQASGKGTDTIVATISNNDGTNSSSPGSGSGSGGSGGGSCGSQPQIAFVQADSPSDSDWVDGLTLTSPPIPDPGDDSIVWLADAQPTVYNAFARANPTDTPTQVRVEVFPAYTVTGTASIQNAADLVAEITAAVSKVVDGFNTAASNLGIQVTQTTMAPAGTMSLTCGWLENSDNQVYYGWEINVGFNPLFGMSWKIQANLLAVAGQLVGIPAGIINYAAGINIGVELGGQLGLTGRAAQTGPGVNQVGINGTGKLTVKFTLEGVVGNEKVVSAQIVGACETGFTLGCTISIQTGTGLVMNPSLTFNGVVLSVNIITSVGGKEASNNQLCAWTACAPWSPPWQPASPWVLLP